MFRGLKALLGGVIAGTALGILFSPKKGKDLRKTIKDEVDEGGTGLSSIKETLVEMGKEIGDTAREAYDEITESEEYAEGKKRLKKSVSNAKKEVKKAYKKNIPAKTRKKVSQTAKKAKTAAKKVVKKIKK